MNADAIVKALKCCNVPSGRACSECPYHEVGEECRTRRNKDAVELIMKLAKENRNLKEEYDTDTLCIDALQDVVECRDKVIEKLVEKNEQLNEEIRIRDKIIDDRGAEVLRHDKCIRTLHKEIEILKEDTVRTMQEKLEKEIDRTIDVFDFQISECNAVRQALRGVKNDIYQIAKEMLEENNV